MEASLRNAPLCTLIVLWLTLTHTGSSYPVNVYVIQKTVNIYTANDGKLTQTTQTMKDNFTGGNPKERPGTGTQGKIRQVLLQLLTKANDLTNVLGLNEDMNNRELFTMLPTGGNVIPWFESTTAHPIMKPAVHRSMLKRICDPDTTRPRARQGREVTGKGDGQKDSVDCFRFPESSGEGEGTWTLEQLTDWYEKSFSRRPKNPLDPRDADY